MDIWGASGKAVKLFNAIVFGAVTLGMGSPAIAAKRSDCRRFFEIALELNRRNTDPIVPKDPPIERLLSVDQIKVTSYNLSSIKHEPDRHRLTRSGTIEKVESGKTKGRAHVNGLAATIIKENADIILFQEAEGVQEARWFLDHKLKGKWVIVAIGDPARSDRLTFTAIRRTLMPHLNIRVLPLDDSVWIDPRMGSYESHLFHRQVQHVMISTLEDEVPFLHVLNVHLKAKFDHASVVARSAQLTGLEKIISGIRYEYGDNVHLLVGGDYNDDFMKSSELPRFMREAKLYETLDLIGVPVDPKYRSTNVLQNHYGQMVYNQLDGILISSSMRRALQASHVVRYYGEHENALPLPISGCEVSCLPSSHRAISATFLLPKLLNSK